ncbi:hypothetical protein ABIG06_004731 [Bradyrhizobium sp. USDA 326]
MKRVAEQRARLLQKLGVSDPVEIADAAERLASWRNIGALHNPMPISLSDSEMAAVMDAAAPIDRRARDAFLREVFGELAKHEVIGPGIIGRVVRDIQRRHLAPRTGHNVVGKWD